MGPSAAAGWAWSLHGSQTGVAGWAQRVGARRLRGVDRPNTEHVWSLRRSELFTVTRQVALPTDVGRNNGRPVE